MLMVNSYTTPSKALVYVSSSLIELFSSLRTLSTSFFFFESIRRLKCNSHYLSARSPSLTARTLEIGSHQRQATELDDASRSSDMRCVGRFHDQRRVHTRQDQLVLRRPAHRAAARV